MAVCTAAALLCVATMMDVDTVDATLFRTMQSAYLVKGRVIPRVFCSRYFVCLLTKHLLCESNPKVTPAQLFPAEWDSPYVAYPRFVYACARLCLMRAPPAPACFGACAQPAPMHDAPYMRRPADTCLPFNAPMPAPINIVPLMPQTRIKGGRYCEWLR